MSNPSSNPSKRIAVIDADGIIYAAACVSEREVLGDVEEGFWVDTQELEECYVQVVTSIEALMKAVQCEDAFICLTHRENFRVALLPTYKANRKATRPPTYRKPLVDLLMERRPFPVLVVQGLEADDVAGISAGSLQAAGHTAIICSDDKDLKTIPGFLYQKGEVVETTQLMADYAHMYQTLTGDSTDNYSGCRNVGPKTATAILGAMCEQGWDGARVWERVLAEFTLRGHSEDYALTQARVARILRASDWDPSKREPILWTPDTLTTNDQDADTESSPLLAA